MPALEQVARPVGQVVVRRVAVLRAQGVADERRQRLGVGRGGGAQRQAVAQVTNRGGSGSHRGTREDIRGTRKLTSGSPTRDDLRGRALHMEPFGFFSVEALRAGWYLIWRQLVRVLPVGQARCLSGFF